MGLVNSSRICLGKVGFQPALLLRARAEVGAAVGRQEAVLRLLLGKKKGENQMYGSHMCLLITL